MLDHSNFTFIVKQMLCDLPAEETLSTIFVARHTAATAIEVGIYRNP
jgi:hypothetical protein